MLGQNFITGQPSNYRVDRAPYITAPALCLGARGGLWLAQVIYNRTNRISHESCATAWYRLANCVRAAGLPWAPDEIPTARSPGKQARQAPIFRSAFVRIGRNLEWLLPKKLGSVFREIGAVFSIQTRNHNPNAKKPNREEPQTKKHRRLFFCLCRLLDRKRRKTSTPPKKNRGCLFFR